MINNLIIELLRRIASLKKEKKRLEEEKKQLQFIQDALEHDLVNDLLNLANVAEFSLHKLNDSVHRNRFEVYQNRLLAMTNFYRLLLAGGAGKPIDSQELIAELCYWMCEKYDRKHIEFDVYSCLVFNDTVANRKTLRIIGEVITELLQNMLKYAFVEQQHLAKVWIEVMKIDGQIYLGYRDNGAGFSDQAFRKGAQGMLLLKCIALENTFRYGNLPEGGAFVQLQIDMK